MNTSENTASAVNTVSSVNTEQKRVQVNCIILTCSDNIKVKNLGGGLNGKYVYQQIKITTEGPLFGMILPATRTLLNKKQEVSEPLEIGAKAVVYLREAHKEDGTPIVFGDLGSGLSSTDNVDIVNAMQAFRNMNSAM